MTDATERLREICDTVTSAYSFIALNDVRAVLTTITTLTAERDAAVKRADEAETFKEYLRSMMTLGTWQIIESEQAFKRRATAAEDRVRVLSEHVRTLSDELGSEIEAKYATTKDYPSERRRYDRDIAPVVAARAALSIKDAGDE